MKTILSNEETGALCAELAILIRAGESPMGALSNMTEVDENNDLLKKLAGDVENGMTLGEALKESGAFPAYMCGLVQAGEEAGRTEEALEALAQYYEDRVRLNRRIRSALLYPAVMLLLMLVVIGVLLVKVLPIFDDVYASLGGALTGVAGGLLTLGRWLDKIMPVLWILLAAVVVFAAAFAVSESFRDKISGSWKKSHGDKGISRKLNNARFAQAMSMCMASSISPEKSAELAAGLMDAGAKERCSGVQGRLEGNESLSAALQGCGVLSASQGRLLEIAQLKGAEDKAMSQIAGNLMEEGETALDTLVSRVEPALVLVCSILVGLILLSVMLPLMHIMAAIG